VTCELVCASLKSDILLFHRRKQDANPNDTKSGAKKRGAAAALARPIAPGELEVEIRVEDLVKENLEMADKKLEILSEHRLTVALDEFVSKEQSKSIEEAMEVMLGSQQKKLVSGSAGEKESQPSSATANKDARGTATSEAQVEDNDMDESSHILEKDDDVSAQNGSKRKRTTAPKTSTASAKRATTTRVASSRKKSAKIVDSDDDDLIVDDDDDLDEPRAKQSMRPAAKTSARPQRVAKVARKNYKVESDDDQEDSFRDDSIDENSDDLLAVIDRPKKQAKSVASSRKIKSTQLSFETTRRPKTTTSKAKQGTKRRADDDDDDESKDNQRFGHSYDIDEDWGKANTETQS
jgi:hypothetical protein